MAENLLHELETSQPVATSLENIEHLLHVVITELTRSTNGLKGSAAAFKEMWGRIVLAVARGNAGEMQAERPRLLKAFESRLKQIRETIKLATLCRQHELEDAPDPDALLTDVVEMGWFKSEVLDQWQTVEDLEDLAARDYPLTDEDLDRIGPQRQPPASFYAEDSKPF